MRAGTLIDARGVPLRHAAKSCILFAMKNTLGKIVGATLFAGATAAVWLWPDAEQAAKPDDSVRPVRSALVEVGAKMPDLHFPGKIRANEDRDLAFKQSGRIQRIPVVAGQQVKKGEKLAWLDPLDFQDNLAQAEAAAMRDRLTCERKRAAGQKNAISKEEISQAEAQLKLSEAQLALAKRALEETILYAPFDGEIAKVPGGELDMVSPLDTVIVFRDVSKVKVDVRLPETMVITSPNLQAVDGERIAKKGPVGKEERPVRATVSFDSVPGRSFPVAFVEYETAADLRSQTYVATFVMDTPKDLMLLPGMSATLSLRGTDYRYVGAGADTSATLPESAVGVGADGAHFAWVLEESGEKGVYVAKRRAIAVADRNHGRVVVSKGLAGGERVATAGVAVLTEGRKVRLLAE